MGSITPKITLYTNHGCPWAHRAHIALAELGLPFETEIIDLQTPRTAEYLKINPRGLVPTLVYNGEIIPESAIVAQFLADAHPSHLLKTSNEIGGSLQRARINFFVDTYFSKVNGLTTNIMKASKEDKEVESEKFVAAIVKEIEPLLQDANPYFGGASKLTLAEVLTGSFLIRILTIPKYEEYGLVPKSILTSLETKAPAFWKWANTVIKQTSVNHIFDEEAVAKRTAAKIAKLAAK